MDEFLENLGTQAGKPVVDLIDLAILFPGAFLWMNFRRRQAEAESAA